MKKVLLLLMASLMVTVFVGCSDDDIIINVISNYTIVDNILDIHGSGNVGNKENPITIIVRGNYLIEELSNDKMVLRETGYGYSYVNKVYGEPPVCYETHWTYTLKKVSE